MWRYVRPTLPILKNVKSSSFPGNTVKPGLGFHISFCNSLFRPIEFKELEMAQIGLIQKSCFVGYSCFSNVFLAIFFPISIISYVL